MEKEQREEMVELYNYSLPGQTKGSHCLGLGAATPPHNHPASALADTAQPRRYGYNTHILGQCKDVPKQKTYTVHSGLCKSTYPHIYPDTQRQRHANTSIQGWVLRHADMYVHMHRYK